MPPHIPGFKLGKFLLGKKSDRFDNVRVPLLAVVKVLLEVGDLFEGPRLKLLPGKTASLTKPAKFVVFLFKNSDEPVFTPVH